MSLRTFGIMMFCLMLAPGGALAGSVAAADTEKAAPAPMTETQKEVRMQGDSGPFPRGNANTAYARYFVGNSYLNMLSTEGVVIGNVTFEPGCRNNWHIHHAARGGGQILLCTAGRGWYQEWGRPARELHPGDVVHIPAGVKHWHGAAADSWFTHLAVEVPGEEARNEWLEAVSDDEYARLSRAR